MNILNLSSLVHISAHGNVTCAGHIYYVSVITVMFCEGNTQLLENLILKVCLFFFFNLFTYWLRWVFVAARGLSLVVASGGYSSLRCTGLPLQWPLLLRSTGSRLAGSVVVACVLQSAGSVVVAHGLSCSVACGILPDQGSNPCPLHWQADS